MLSPKKMSVVNRIFLWLVAISLVTMFILAFMGWEVRDTMREYGLKRIHNILKHKQNDIDAFIAQQFAALNNLEQLLYFSSQHHHVFSFDFWKKPPSSLQESLGVFASENQFYDIFVITLDGDIVYSVKHEEDFHTNLLRGPYKETQLAHVFTHALQQYQPYISDFEYYLPSRDFAAFIAVPVVKKGEMIGVVAVQMQNNALQQIINDSEELGRSGEMIAIALRENGQTITMAPIRNSRIGAFSYLNAHDVRFLNALPNTSSGCDYMADRTGNAAAVAWGDNDLLRWKLIASIDEHELLEVWYKQMVSLSVLFVMGVSVVMTMIVMAFRSFSRPVHELTEYASKIAGGNYEINIDSSEYDAEWQLFVDAFEKMSLEINHRIHQLNEQNALLLSHKNEIEELNQNLEAKVAKKSKQLKEYIKIIDQNIITSQTDRNGNITYASEAYCKISGYTKEELLGKNHRIARHPDMPEEFFAQMWETISKGQTWHGEMKNKKADGGFYWADTVIYPNYEDEELVGYTAIRHDITYQKMVEELAVTDSLTGLYNRRFFVKTLSAEMNRAKRHGFTLALLMFDVDYFKFYNDKYGHHAGDTVLVRVAEILKEYTSRNGEYAFRLGGEEFAIVLNSMEEEEYLQFADRIRREIENMTIPHEYNTASEFVTASVGVAIYYPDSEMSLDELYKKADAYLYEAKENGRNRVVCMQMQG